MRKTAGWAVLLLGTAGLAWWAHGNQARQIETQVSDAAKAAAVGSVHDVQVRVSGRDIIVEGLADSQAELDQIKDTLNQVPGRRIVRADMEILPSATPYTFGLTKTVEGVLENGRGVAPTAGDAAALNAAVPNMDLELASGAPTGWSAAVSGGVTALNQLREGTLEVTDTALTLRGTAQSGAELAAIDAAISDLPEGFTATREVTLLDDGQPADFDLSYNATTGVTFTGRLAEGLAGADLGARLGAADITDESSADLAPADIGAIDTDQTRILIEAIAPQMPQIEALDLSVMGARPGQPNIAAQMALAARPDADANAVVSAITDALPSEIAENLDVSMMQAPAPAEGADTRTNQITGAQEYLIDGQWAPAQDPYTLSAAKDSSGITLGNGYVPSSQARAAIADAGVDAAGLVPAYGAPDGWGPAAAAGIQSLAPLNEGTLDLTGTDLTLTGQAATPAEAQAAEAALANLPEGYVSTAVIEVLDDGVDADYSVSYSAAEGAKVEGRLPAGLTASDIASAMGLGGIIDQTTTDESGGAEADIAAGKSLLQSLAPWMSQVETLNVDLPQGVAQSGTTMDLELALGADGAAAQEALASALPQGTDLALRVQDSLPEGASTTRTNAATGLDEQVRDGFWLPVWKFQPNAEACAQQSATVLKDYKINFVSGSDEIEGSSSRALSALASMMEICIAADLTAELGGHTDSTGSAELNQKLSQGRADAVMQALVERGIPAEAMVAKGYGPDKPIASNDTEEGRAENRRTEILWAPKGAASTQETAPTTGN